LLPERFSGINPFFEEVNMARVTIEDCLREVNNRFMLVHLGAKRVIQLRKGATPLVEAPKNKEVVLALREIAAGLVTFDSIAQIEPDELVAEALPEQGPEEAETEAITQKAAEETPPQTAESEEGEEVAEE
jgi:DNA-directed RNA polymerase subunit omega